MSLSEFLNFFKNRIGVLPSIIGLSSIMILHFWGFVIKADNAFFGVVDFNFFSIFMFIFIGNLVIATLVARILLYTAGGTISFLADILPPNQLFRRLRIFLLRKKYKSHRFIIYIVLIICFFSLQYIGYRLSIRFFLYIGVSIFMGYLLGRASIFFRRNIKGIKKGDHYDIIVYNKDSNLSFLLILGIALLLSISFLAGIYRMEYLKSHKEVVIELDKRNLCAVILGSTYSGYISYVKIQEKTIFFPFGVIKSIGEKSEKSKCT